MNRWLAPVAVLAVIAVAVGVVLVTRNDDQAAATAASGGSSASSTPAPSDRNAPSSPFVDRPGFDRASLPEGTGDPAALVTEAQPTPVTINTTDVIQACSLLPVERVRELPRLRGSGILPLGVSRSYFDGVSTLAVDASDLYASVAENTCTFNLYPAGVLSITVFQPGYHPANALDHSVRKEYRKAGAVAGFDLYKRRPARDPADRDADYLLRDGDSAVTVMLDQFDEAEPGVVEPLAKDVLESIAAGYTRESAAPTGPARFTYDTPSFTEPYLHSCDILTANDLQEQQYGDVHPLVEESFPAVTTVMQREEPRELIAATVQNECTRMVVTEGGPVGIALNSMSFMDPRAAELLLGELRREWGGANLRANIGDEAFFAKVADEQQIVVRSGRFLLFVSAPDVKGMNKQEFVDTFRPITQTIVRNSEGPGEGAGL